MPLIKRKSLIVALVSSFVVSAVLILTLVGYLVYIELKGEEFRRAYQELLHKVNAKVYSKYVDIPKLRAKIEVTGALKGKLVIEGLLENKGARTMSDIVVKVKFLDRDGAMVYNVVFHPQEPSLGASALPQVSLPYIYGHAKTAVKPGMSLPFKVVLSSCPGEIIAALKESTGYAKAPPKWSGKLVYEVLAIEL